MVINLPELKRQRGPKCELFTSATEARNQRFIKARDLLGSWQKRRKGSELCLPFLCLPHQFIICCFKRFILSIFCFLPHPSPPGSEGKKKSQPSTRLQVALKYFTAKRKKKKKSYGGKQVRKGLPRGDWFRLEGSNIRKARGHSSHRSPARRAQGRFRCN